MAPRCYSLPCRGGCSPTQLGCSPMQPGCSPMQPHAPPSRRRAAARSRPGAPAHGLAPLPHLRSAVARAARTGNLNPDPDLHPNLNPNPSPGPNPNPSPSPNPNPNSVQAIGYAAMSGAVSHWFFFRDQPSERQRLPVTGSLWRAVRLPWGSLACNPMTSRLQPHVSRLQPHVFEAATACTRGCDRMCPGALPPGQSRLRRAPGCANAIRANRL